MLAGTDFQVRRDDLRTSRVVDLEVPGADDLADGEALLSVDRFAVTANNVTYAVYGDAMGYWRFFPAEDGWGHVPVWGFGDVVASRAEGVEEGERFYGYFPTASHLVVRPVASRSGFVDGAEHRDGLPGVYNQYPRTATDPGYDPAREGEQMLYRPLFFTSWLVADHLEGDGWFGAETVVIASASSKTAYGTAYVIAQQEDRPELVGLTSPRNREFTEGLGVYDRVAAYDDVSSLPADVPVALVDMAGSTEVRASVHEHFGDGLRHSAVVGATHWEEQGDRESLPGARPTFFFAPAQMQKRIGEWGAAELNRRFAAAWNGFVPRVGEWIEVAEDAGPQALERVWLEHVEGRADPRLGHVLSLLD